MIYRRTISYLYNAKNDKEAIELSKKYIKRLEHFDDNQPRLELLERVEFAKPLIKIYPKEN